MKMTDKEIADNLNEIRLEKALAAELLKTEQIIKRTGLFDPIDNIYGEIGAEYQAGNPQEGGDMGGGAMGGGGFGAGLGGDMGDMGGDIDSLGAPGAETEGDISGNAGTTGMDSAAAADAGTATMEGMTNKKPLILEIGSKTKNKKMTTNLFEEYLTKLKQNDDLENERMNTRVDFVSENLILNESTQELLDGLSERLKAIDEETPENNVL
jgi:hypothetical protein